MPCRASSLRTISQRTPGCFRSRERASNSSSVRPKRISAVRQFAALPRRNAEWFLMHRRGNLLANAPEQLRSVLPIRFAEKLQERVGPRFHLTEKPVEVRSSFLERPIEMALLVEGWRRGEQGVIHLGPLESVDDDTNSCLV
jgi:hypothetical protein